MISLTGSKLSADYNKLAYDFSFTNIDGTNLNLSKYKGKIIIVVNVASQCGFTNQYTDMQKVWEKYKDKGLIMLGVPSNDFGGQEPGTNTDIKDFCETNFGITFPMTEKVSVKGDEAHPFYMWAKDNYGNSAVPKWNFHKIIIDKNGKVLDTFASITKPTSGRFIKALESALK
tara:strand:- start:319 stop:837 length:519 start_codon:yes stop_codon:yes gene_type:complete